MMNKVARGNRIWTPGLELLLHLCGGRWAVLWEIGESALVPVAAVSESTAHMLMPPRIPRGEAPEALSWPTVARLDGATWPALAPWWVETGVSAPQAMAWVPLSKRSALAVLADLGDGQTWPVVRPQLENLRGLLSRCAETVLYPEAGALGQLVRDIGRRFLLQEEPDVRQSITDALGEVATALGADHAQLFRLPPTDSFHASHFWQSPDVPPLSSLIPRLPAPIIHWTLAQLRQGRVLTVPHDRMAEQERTIMDWLEPLGIQSALAAPMVYEGETIGCMAFGGQSMAPLFASDMDALKWIAQVLAAAEHHYRLHTEERLQAQYLSHVREAIIATTLDGPILYWSAGAERLYGYADAEIIGHDVFELNVTTRAALPTPAEMIEAEGWRGQVVRRHKDGHVFTTDTSLSLVWDEDRQPIGFVSLDRDITEQQRAEQARTQSERDRQLLLDAIPDLIDRIGADGVYRDFVPSKEWPAVCTPEEAIGHSIYDVLPHDLAARRMAKSRMVLETGRTEIVRFELDVAGETHYYESRIVPSGPDETMSIVRDMTELWREEQARTQSERDRQVLLDAIPDLIDRVGADGVYRDFVPSTEWDSLCTPEEAIGHSIYDVLPHDMAAQRMAECHAVLETGRPQRVQYDLVVDGAKRHYESRILPSGSDETLSIVRDITDQRQAEASLRASQRQVELLLDAIPDLLARIDRNGVYRYLHASPIWHPYFDLEAAIGQRVQEMMPADVAQVTMAAVERALDSGQPQTYEYSLIEEGQERWYEARVVPAGDDEVLGMVRDVTDRHQAQDDLRASKQYLESVIQALPDLLARFDRQGTMVDLIPSTLWEPLTYPDVAIGQSVFEALPPEPARLTWEAIQRVLETGNPYVYHYDAIIGGKQRYREVRMVPAGPDETLAVVTDITERHAAEEALAKSEREHQMLLNAIPDMLGRLDRNGVFLDFRPSPEWDPVFTPEEGIGKSVYELMPQHVADLRMEHCRRALETGAVQTYEYALEQEDGLHYFESRVVPSGPDETLSIVRDITERRQAEQALEASKRDMESLLAAIPDLLARIDRQGRFTSFRPSPEWPALFDEDYAIGKSMFEALPEHVATKTWEALQRALASGETQLYEYELDEARGSHTYEARMVLANQDGVLCIVRDVTKQRRMEQELQLKNKAIDEALNAVSLTDLDGYNTYVNAAFLDMWGYADQAEVIGRYGPGFWDDPQQAKTIMQALQGQGHYEGEMRAVRPDGTRFDVQLVAGLIRDEQERPLAMVGSFLDITDRKRYEAQINENAAELRALNRLSVALSEASNLDAMVEVALDHVVKAIKVTVGGLYLLEEERDQLRMVALRGLDWETAQQITIVPTSTAPFPTVEETLAPAMAHLDAPLPVWQRDALQPTGITRFVVIPLISRERIVGTINLGLDPDRRLSEREMAFVLTMGAQIGPNIETAQLNRELQRAQQALRALYARLARDLEAERIHLSHELHDQVGQSLTAIKLTLQMARGRLANDPAAMNGALSQSIDLVDATTDQVRKIAAGLRPVAIEELGLVPALREYMRRFEDRTGIRAGVVAGDFEADLELEQETAIYRIVQEALTNVTRHADASEAYVYLVSKPDLVEVVIQDNGVGFDVETVRAETDHLGLVGMNERAEQIGGAFEIHSVLDEGTSIIVRIPLR